MRLLLVLLLAAVPSGAFAVALQDARVMKGAPQPGSQDCPRTTSYYAYRDGKPLKPQKLNELPPANTYLAVFRHIGRCEAPIIVKYNVGGR
jgi:hypothetical protein